MAEGGVCKNSSYSNCPICLETLSVPRTLPCQHTYCDKCLSSFIENSVCKQGENTSFNCPICRASVPPTAEDQDPKEWMTPSADKSSAIVLPQSLKTKVDHVCDSCSARGDSKTANGFCMDCKEHICEQCIGLHQKLNILITHKILTMEELSEQLTLANGAVMRENCKCHQEKEIKYFCKDHTALCCDECQKKLHSSCTSVVDIQRNSQIPFAEEPNDLLVALKHIEEYLVNYFDKNESYMKKLQTETTCLSDEVDRAKDKAIKLFDLLKKDVSQEGHNIYRNECFKKTEENRRCQSLLAAVRNNYHLLDTINRLGCSSLFSITAHQVQEQLINYRDKVVKMYRKFETKEVSITLDDKLKSLFSLQGSKLALVQSKIKTEDLPLSGVFRTPTKIKSVIFAKDGHSEYQSTNTRIRGAAFVQGNIFVLHTGRYSFSHACCLYNSKFQHISEYEHFSRPWDVCVFDEVEVVVSLPEKLEIQFLTSTVPITLTRSIKSRYPCYGLALLSKDRLIVSGYVRENIYYWSILCTSGEEEYYHDIDVKDDICSIQRKKAFTYVAIDSSNTRLFLTCNKANSVYCFGLDGHLYFTYKDTGLQSPMGIGLDKDNNIYVVEGSGCLYQLSPGGTLIQVLRRDIPKKPERLVFDKTGLTFLLTLSDASYEREYHIFKIN